MFPNSINVEKQENIERIDKLLRVELFLKYVKKYFPYTDYPTLTDLFRKPAIFGVMFYINLTVLEIYNM